MMLACQSQVTLQRRFEKCSGIINARPILHQENRLISAYELCYGRPPNTIRNSNQIIEIGKGQRIRQELRKRFEKLWKIQHMNNLRMKFGPNDKIKIKPGDKILLPKSNIFGESQLASVLETKESKDGITRKLKVKLNDGKEFSRPVRGVAIIGKGGENVTDL